MAKEPEQMQPQHRVAALVGQKEARAEVAVEQQEHLRHRQRREGEDDNKRGHQCRPHEQRHAIQLHAWCTHVQNSHNEVDATGNRGHTSQC